MNLLGWRGLLVISPMLALSGSSILAGGNSPPRITAEDLTAAYVKNAATASKTYGDAMNPKELLVVGTVDKLVDGTYGKIAKLKGTGKAVVSCLLRREDAPNVKEGDRIVIKGRSRGFFPKDQSVDLNGGAIQKDTK